jgi:hypothetical protein
MQFSGKVVVKKEKNRLGLRWGNRKSDKLVRAYEKPEVGAYRVELEFHPRQLRREQILTLDDLDDLADVICPQHFQFVEVDWQRLQRQLKKFGSRGKYVLAEARTRAKSLSRVRRYLRRKGIVNFHRFLVPLPINDEVNRALGRWARQFESTKLCIKTDINGKRNNTQR